MYFWMHFLMNYWVIKWDHVFWPCTKSENSICGGSVTISIQILTSSNWTPLSCSGWYQRFTSSLWAKDCLAGFPVRQNLTWTTTILQAHAAFSGKWSLLLIILCKAHANTKVYYTSNDKSGGNQWFLLSPSGVINIPQMFGVLQEQNVKTFSSA